MQTNIPEKLAPTGLQFQTVNIGNYKIRSAIAYAENPTSSTPLLIFNGFGASLEMLVPLMTAFSGRNVISFDLPGVGESSRHLLPKSIHRIATLTGHILDHLQLEQIDVMGFSWGGFPAQQFARHNQHRCRRLVLAATSPGAIMVPGVRSTLQLLCSPGKLASKDKHYQQLDEAEKVHLRYYFSHSQALRQLPSRLSQTLTCLGWTSAHWLQHISQPTLILSGDRDPLVPTINARFMARRIPHSRLVLIDGGHLFLLLRKHQVVRQIEDFLTA